MIDLLYLLAAALFIYGLRYLGSPRTARRGNAIASAGMLLAVIVVLVDLEAVSYWTIVIGLVIGTLIGGVLARRVAMTSMPELVAAFNGFGGLASVLVALAEVTLAGALPVETAVTVALSVAIGTITFTGSVVAFGKLNGQFPGRPIVFPGNQVVNAVAGAVILGFAVWGVVAAAGDTRVTLSYWLIAGVAAVLGVLLVIPIGGADMPVVISLLNSMSGLAAAAAGFVIANSALIIGGALVGAAGLILTIQMAEAMNRTVANVLFGAFGGVTGAVATSDKPVNRASPEDVAIALAYADRVMVVPGYGLAVAQAQHATKDLGNALEAKGITVEYAIHPVAGRMPGHMNVLLAEADVSYDKLLDLEQANPRMPNTDVVLVIGANDVVNPSAHEQGSAIYGMPILEVDQARTVVVIKRSLSPGFAGIDNPLFYEDHTLMLFADGKAAVESVMAALETV